MSDKVPILFISPVKLFNHNTSCHSVLVTYYTMTYLLASVKYKKKEISFIQQLTLMLKEGIHLLNTEYMDSTLTLSVRWYLNG